MRFTKQTGGGGGWIKSDEVQDGARVAILTETIVQEGEYEGKPNKQNVAKVKVEGIDEVKNVSINKTSVNALIDAFGEDSKDWIKKTCTLKVETTIINNKRRKVLYFIPEGFEMAEDENGYIVVQRGGQTQEKATQAEIPVVEDEIDVADIPF